MFDDSTAFEVVNPAGRRPVLILCDHASRHVPDEFRNLGLEESQLRRHIGWDIGAADVSRRLAGLLDATAVLSGVSRLVIDCNRAPGTPASIPVASDGVPVPGNSALGEAERRRRVQRFFQPYHGEIERRLAAFAARGQVPALISVHSFTPVMNGFQRPWHVGLLWDHDDRMARPLIAELRHDPSLAVGDNQPYSGREPRGFALHTYGKGRGLPMAVFEVRQDLIDTHHGAEAWAYRLAAALRPVLADPALYRVRTPD
ncbi:MAG: N-formylglutamate amidohydrolase [Alphaproteobacteria bacterium]|nr:N-formylglutamate amidohydrolase [Alphaproteobacteria bacterium]